MLCTGDRRFAGSALLLSGSSPGSLAPPLFRLRFGMASSDIAARGNLI
jgi:hypothetical protein